MAGCEFGSEKNWSWVKKKIHSEYPDVQQLSTKELYSWLKSEKNSSLVLLDVRDPEEYAVSHLAGAYLVETEKEALDIIGAKGKDRTFVLYCSVGYRSSKLASILQSKGYGNVFNLEGSIFQWVNEGKEIYRGSERVYAVHPYNSIWKQLLAKKYWYDRKSEG